MSSQFYAHVWILYIHVQVLFKGKLIKESLYYVTFKCDLFFKVSGNVFKILPFFFLNWNKWLCVFQRNYANDLNEVSRWTAFDPSLKMILTVH